MIELMTFIVNLEHLQKIITEDILEPLQSSEKAADTSLYVDGYLSGIERSIALARAALDEIVADRVENCGENEIQHGIAEFK